MLSVKSKKLQIHRRKNFFFFNKVLEKYTPVLTEKYFSLCNENKIKISPQKEQSYQINIRDSIAQWIQDTFICEILEEQKNLQIKINEEKESIKEKIKGKKEEKILEIVRENFTNHLKKIPIPLSNIFEEIQNKTHPIANDIINLYKKNPESFKEHLEIEKPELLAANNTDSGEVSLNPFKDFHSKNHNSVDFLGRKFSATNQRKRRYLLLKVVSLEFHCKSNRILFKPLAI